MLKDIDLKHSSYWLDFSLKLNKKNEKLFSTASIEKRDQPRHQISRTASQQFYHDTNIFLTFEFSFLSKNCGEFCASNLSMYMVFCKFIRFLSQNCCYFMC